MYTELKNQFIDFYKQQSPVICSYYRNLNHQDKLRYFYDLRNIAKQDLSWAHCIQHDQTSKISCAIASLNHYIPESDFFFKIGTHSTVKKFDTCYIKDSKIYGEKYYLSGVPFSDFSTLYVKDSVTNDTYTVFMDYSDIDFDIDGFKPIGMENTLTGTLKFHGQSLHKDQIINHQSDSRLFERARFNDAAFPTNCIGLCAGLIQDIEKFIVEKDFEDLSYHLKKLKIDMYSYEQIWESIITRIVDAQESTDYYNDSFLLYNCGKKMLSKILNYMLEIGTGEFYQLDEKSQRFRDALIYNSHQHNFYSSTHNFFRHRKNVDFTETERYNL